MNLYALSRTASICFKKCIRNPVLDSFRPFHSSSSVLGFEEFKDQVRADEVVKTGRAWTNADLRRKVFYVYAEILCHLLLLELRRFA